VGQDDSNAALAADDSGQELNEAPPSNRKSGWRLKTYKEVEVKNERSRERSQPRHVDEDALAERVAFNEESASVSRVGDVLVFATGRGRWTMRASEVATVGVDGVNVVLEAERMAVFSTPDGMVMAPGAGVTFETSGRARAFAAELGEVLRDAWEEKATAALGRHGAYPIRELEDEVVDAALKATRPSRSTLGVVDVKALWWMLAGCVVAWCVA